MFDSLNRHMLPNYGYDLIHAPNFEKLGKKTVTFDNCYAGSLPCMPARRELHTGRYNFLHRSWSPLEPFDDSMPEILKNNGIYTHIVSDHYHYWEDGGCNYHNRYNSWEISRGQEGDPWIGQVREAEHPDTLNCHQQSRQDWINRAVMNKEKNHPQARTFARGMDFIKKNSNEDNWFLTIETFDPHQPFFATQRFRDMYTDDYKGPHFDWPVSGATKEDENTIKHVCNEYSALVSMCDYYLGKLLALMDEENLWEDTMLIVNVDHGYLLGEHGYWSKVNVPQYQEIAHIPLFIWDPRNGVHDKRNKQLVQTIDIAPTLLEYFGISIPKDMQGVSLKDTIATNSSVREAGLFGFHGYYVNVTDGEYVYMRAPVNRENTVYEYGMMPTHMDCMFSIDELKTAVITEEFSFTKGVSPIRYQVSGKNNYTPGSHLLFNISTDPTQIKPINDSKIEAKMISYMIELMKENDAPIEQFSRLGLEY